MSAQRTLGSCGDKRFKSLEANVLRKVVSRYKKKLFWREIHAFSSSSYRNFWAMLIRGKFKFLFE